MLMNMNSENPPLLDYLEKKGITLKDLVNTALELFVPHPGLETEKAAAEMLREEFLDALSDVNVSTLEEAWANNERCHRRLGCRRIIERVHTRFQANKIVYSQALPRCFWYAFKTPWQSQAVATMNASFVFAQLKNSKSSLPLSAPMPGAIE